MNQTPSGERIHIAFFGLRNVGKSSLVNAFTGQNLSIVSSVKGTTTDPVYKAMELLPLGPVQIIDTPGIDDEGSLGELRVKKSLQVLNKTDIAIIVTTAGQPLSQSELSLMELIKAKEIPYILVYNKSDLLAELPPVSGSAIYVSAQNGTGIHELKELTAKSLKKESTAKPLVSDLLPEGSTAVLVVPIDKSAPKGRLILPQQQVIRDLLDHGISAMICRDSELADTLQKLAVPPDLVITDSQVFGKVNAILPKEVSLTSFSILMARYKGDLGLLASGAASIEEVQTGDKILIAEGCTHHRQCEDIGTVKLPNWIRKHTGTEPDFHFCSGTEFPDDLTPYKMVIHCGGCMLNAKEMRYRLRCCQDQNIPVTNYGTLIAYLNGILERSMDIFKNM